MLEGPQRPGSQRQPDTLDGKVGAFYRSFMDEARIEKLGASPLAAATRRPCATQRSRRARRRSWAGRTSTSSRHCSRPTSTSTSRIRRATSSTSRSRASACPTATTTSSLNSRRPRTAYQAYVAQLLRVGRLARRRRAREGRRRVRDADRRRRVGRRRSSATRSPLYNPMTSGGNCRRSRRASTGRASSPALDLSQATRLIVAGEERVSEDRRGLRKAPLATLRAWHAFHVADNAAPYLSKPVRRRVLRTARQDADGPEGAAARAGSAASPPSAAATTIGAVRLRSARWASASANCTRRVTSAPEAKAKIEALVANLKAAYRARIETSRLDEPGHEERSPEEARHVHDQGRLSRSSARLLRGRDRERRSRRQRAPCRGRRLGVLHRAPVRAGRSHATGS